MPVKHNTYFEGAVQSLGLPTERARATVGVIEPGGEYSFAAAEEEHLRVLEGTFRFCPDGGEWRDYVPDQICTIPAGTHFKIAAGERPVAYICYYYPKVQSGPDPSSASS